MYVCVWIYTYALYMHVCILQTYTYVYTMYRCIYIYIYMIQMLVIRMTGYIEPPEASFVVTGSGQGSPDSLLTSSRRGQLMCLWTSLVYILRERTSPALQHGASPRWCVSSSSYWKQDHSHGHGHGHGHGPWHCYGHCHYHGHYHCRGHGQCYGNCHCHCHGHGHRSGHSQLVTALIVNNVTVTIKVNQLSCSKQDFSMHTYMQYLYTEN